MTSERKVAYLKNILQVQILNSLFDKAKATALSFTNFKAELSETINKRRLDYRTQLETTTSASMLNGTHAVKASPNHPSVGKNAFSRFIEYKKLENVTQLTIQQLPQRCSYFLNCLSRQGGAKPNIPSECW
ncbi:hypothetical protein [Vibrio methylphosphonaticus]|uniref:hypothetical protein n=1 Tax=Vibrio methylphosphonaticus TaxID=2946866 RepID=UPI00202A7044|nr:hypothetical protein [Vibrio methylphosphonaticus]MCL9777194.1 hypothetical protein [Vibrio methylphosphonaticus]